MAIRTVCLLFLSLQVSTSLCRAQESQAPLSTDRPSVGTGTDLVPVHAMEIENGVTVTNAQGRSSVDLPETLTRYGWNSRVELRAALPNTHLQRGLPVSREDVEIAAKIRLRPAESRWPVSLVPGINVPTGTASLTSGGWDPSLVLSVSHGFSQRLSMFASSCDGAISTPGSKGHSLLTQNAMDVGWALNSSYALFGEYAPFYKAHDGIRGETLDVGGLWTVGRRVQLDARVGTTRTPGSSSLMVSAGYSVRR